MKQINEIAKRKAGNIKTWEPYFYELLTEGVIVKGYLIRTKKSGKNKGK